MLSSRSRASTTAPSKCKCNAIKCFRHYTDNHRCPHRRAFVLSDGLIGDDYKTDSLWISCPLHKRNYQLKGESAGKCSNDEAVDIATFPVEAREDGIVYVKLPPVDELDSVLGTEKWRVKKEEEVDALASVNKKYQVGRRVDGNVRDKASSQAQAIMAGGERASNSMDW